MPRNYTLLRGLRPLRRACPFAPRKEGTRHRYDRAPMKDSIRQKLDRLRERFEEVGRLLADPDTLAQQNRFRDLSMEYARLEPVARRYGAFLGAEQDLKTAREMAA